MKDTIDHNRDSVYARIGGVMHKSCPCCTRREGVLVMLPVSEFGIRKFRESGAEHVQPWCSPCRSSYRAEATA